MGVRKGIWGLRKECEKRLLELRGFGDMLWKPPQYIKKILIMPPNNGGYGFPAGHLLSPNVSNSTGAGLRSI